eukprot:1151850-Pelagomonas_calceolata.AAC.3
MGSCAWSAALEGCAHELGGRLEGVVGMLRCLLYAPAFRGSKKSCWKQSHRNMKGGMQQWKRPYAYVISMHVCTFALVSYEAPFQYIQASHKTREITLLSMHHNSTPGNLLQLA